jgi:hypothetical protein
MLFSEFLNENKTIIQFYEAGPCCKVDAWNYNVININEDRHSNELNISGIL